jgi:hypothetical protein
MFSFVPIKTGNRVQGQRNRVQGTEIAAKEI